MSALANTCSSADRKGQTLAALLWTAVAVSWLAGIVLSGLPHRLDGDDDRLYLYSTGLALAHPELAARLSRDIGDFLRDEGHSPHALFRWDQRLRYQYNYVLPSAVIYAVSRVVGPASYPDYLDFLYTVLRAAFLTLHGVALLALAAGLLATRCARVAAFVAASLMNPDGGLSITGSTPRNLLALLMMLVFAWRIHGWHARSYWLLLVLGLVHQGMAGLALLSLAGVDLVLRPRVLLRWSAGIPLAAGILLFLLRDRLLFSFLSPAAVGVALAALAGVACLAWLKSARGGPASTEGAAPDAGDARLIAAELILLLVQFGACLAVAYFMMPRADEFTARYFWAELPGRFGALLQPGLMMLGMQLAVCGVFLSCGSRLLNRRTLWPLTVAVCAVLLAGAGILFGRQMTADFPKLRADLARLEFVSESFAEGRLGARRQSFDAIQQREAVLFCALSETMDLSNDALGTLLRRASER